MAGSSLRRLPPRSPPVQARAAATVGGHATTLRVDERAVVTTFTIEYSDARDRFISALVDDLATNPLALRYFYAFRLLHCALDDVYQVREVISASIGDRAIDDATIAESVLQCVVASAKLLSVLKAATAQMMKDFQREVSSVASVSDMLTVMDDVYYAALERSNKLKHDGGSLSLPSDHHHCPARQYPSSGDFETCYKGYNSVRKKHERRAPTKHVNPIPSLLSLHTDGVDRLNGRGKDSISEVSIPSKSEAIVASKKVETTVNLLNHVRGYSREDDVNTAIRLAVEALGRDINIKNAERWFNELFAQLSDRRITSNPSAVEQAQINLQRKVTTDQDDWRSAWVEFFNTMETVEAYKWYYLFDTDKPRADISNAVLATIAMWKAVKPEDMDTWYNDLQEPVSTSSGDCRLQ